MAELGNETNYELKNTRRTLDIALSPHPSSRSLLVHPETNTKIGVMRNR